MMRKPVPIPTSDTAAYWAACNRSELIYQRCNGCGHVQFYPRRSCIECQGGDLAWLQSARRGAVHSFTIVQRAANRAFDGDVPFVIALIDLDEGFRMMMNVVGEDRLSVKIGSRVCVVFEPCSNEQKLPQAKLDAAP
jgi:uncharacterized protein